MHVKPIKVDDRFPWIRAVDKTLVLLVQGSLPGWRKGRNT